MSVCTCGRAATHIVVATNSKVCKVHKPDGFLCKRIGKPVGSDLDGAGPEKLVAELTDALAAVLDGAEGYECEHGSSDRYWVAGTLDRARATLAAARRRTAKK